LPGEKQAERIRVHAAPHRKGEHEDATRE
jgi:hypothetical protein